MILYKARPCLSSPDCQVYLERDGSLKVIAECLTRRHYRKTRTAPITSFDVPVKLVLKDAGSARKPI